MTAQALRLIASLRPLSLPATRCSDDTKQQAWIPSTSRQTRIMSPSTYSVFSMGARANDLKGLGPIKSEPPKCGQNARTRDDPGARAKESPAPGRNDGGHSRGQTIPRMFGAIGRLTPRDWCPPVK